MSKLLLIDSRVADIEYLTDCTLPGVDVITFEYLTTTFDELKSMITKPYDSVCIAQHNYANPSIKLLDCMEGADIIDVETTDPTLSSWAPVVDLFSWLHVERGVETIDLLACFLWSNPNWRYVIQKMESDIGIDIRASLNITGDDGDFVMESDNVDLVGIYFTPQITDYKYSFFYASNSFGPHNSWNPPIDLPLGGGTITAAKYSSFIGTMIGCSLPAAATLINPPASISNVVNLYYTCSSSVPYAYAALTSSGQLVCWGSSKGGADVSGVSANLASGVSKVFTNGVYFTALKTDGTAYCWGYHTDGTSVNTSNTSNRIPPATMTGVVDVATCYNGSATAILKSNGSVECWGQINGWTNLSTALSLLTSGCSKIYGGYGNNAFGFIVLKSDGTFVVFGSTGYITSSTFGISGITEMYSTDYGALAYKSSTRVLYRLSGGATAIYTVPAGINIVRVVPQSSSYEAYVMFSDSSMLNTSNSSITTNVSQVCVGDTTAWAYIRNGGVVCGGDTRFGGSTTDTNNGIKSGISVSSGVIKLCSSGGSIAALKSDGTVAVWGANNGGWPATQAIQSQLTNVVHLFDTQAGYVAITSDNRIITWGENNNNKWYGTPSTNSQTATIASGYNMSLFSTYCSFAPIDVASQIVMSPSALTPGVSTNMTLTTTYQHKMAVKGRKYNMYDANNNLLSTFVPDANTYTFAFNSVVMPATSSSFTIVDTTDASFNVVTYIPPPSPTITSATAGSKSVSIAFTTGNLQGNAITKYQYSTDGSTWTDASGTTSPITITGLTAGTTYVVYLKQFNSYGGSAASAASESFIPYDVPGTPTITSVVGTDSGIVVNYSAALYGLPITAAQYSLNGGAYTSASSFSSSQISISGLTNGTNYTVAIKVSTSAGLSGASATSSAIMPYPAPAAPGAPTITAVAFGNSTASITFTNGTNTGPSILGYKYSADGGSTYTVAPGTSSPLIITGLTNNTSYSFILKAFNAGGDSVASSASTAGKPYALPSTPYISDITMPSSQTLKLAVIPANAYNATTLTYSYSLNSGAYVLGTLDASNNMTITGLTNGTSYAVCIKATTEFGDSGASNTITRTPVGTPAAPTISSSTSGYASGTVSVTNGAYNGGTFLGYKYKIDGGATEYSASSSPISITGLTNGTTYTITVSTLTNTSTGVMQSAYSAGATLSPVITLPAAPSIVSATSDYEMGTIVVSPNNMYGMTIIGYKYKINGGATEYWADNSTIIIDGLTNGTTYSITTSVVGTNQNGTFQSAYSATAASITPVLTLPAAPSIVSSSSDYKMGTVIVSPNNMYGMTIMGYKYKIDNGATEYWADASAIEISGLTNGTTYSIKVSVVGQNANGSFQSAYSTSIASITPVLTLPAAPSIVSVVPDYKMGTVIVSPNNMYGMSIMGYKYKIDNGTTEYWADASAIEISGLTNGTTYSIKVSVVGANVNGAFQSAYSDAASLTPVLTLPDAPLITGSTSGYEEGTVSVSNGDMKGMTVLGYKYKINGGATEHWADSQTFAVRSLTNGNTYTITVSVVGQNEDGAFQSLYSANSATLSPVTTLPDVPTVSTVSPGNTIAEVSMSNNNLNGLSFLGYRYKVNGETTVHWSAVSPFIIRQLTNDASASVVVSTVAYNDKGVFQSAYSSPTTFVPFATLPDAPTFDVIEPGNESVIITYVPGNTNGMNVIGYKYSIDGTTYSYAPAKNNQYTITGLTNGQTYTVQMIAVAETGNSLPSTASNSFIPYTVPDSPTITSVIPGDGQITVSFSDGASNGRSITGYRYSLNNAAFVDVSGVSSGAYVINGLENEVLYSVRMTALNLAGESTSSTPSTPVLTYTTPGVPTILSVAPGDRSAIVHLKLPDMQGSILSAYEYSLDVGVSWVLVDASANMTSYMTDSFTIPNLTNGDSYNVKIRIVGSGGTSDSSALSAAVIPCKPPNAPVINSVIPGDKKCIVNFTVPENNGSAITKYSYSLNGGEYQTALQLSSPLTIYSLDNSANYVMDIRATNSAGISVASNTSESFVPYAVPEAPVITQLLSGDKCVYLYYTCIAYGAPITKYQYSTGAAYVDFSGIEMPYVISNLTNKTTANITIRAVNKAGISPISNLRSIIVGTPQIPIVTSLVPGNKQITLNFNFQAKNGTVKQINGSVDGGLSYVKLFGTDVSAVAIQKLNNGTVYTPQIQIVNENGLSDWSLPIGNCTPAAVPNKLVITSQTFNELGVATVAIGPTVDNGAPITSYKYSIGTADTVLYDISGTTSPFQIRDLSNNVMYSFKLYAVNSMGISLASAPSKPSSSVFLPPAVPGNVAAGIKTYYLDLSGGQLCYMGTPMFDASCNPLTTPGATVPLYTSETNVQYISDASAVAYVIETAYVDSKTSPLTPILSYKYSLNLMGSTVKNPYVDAGLTTSPMRMFVAPNKNYIVSLASTNLAGMSVGSAPTKPVTAILLPPTTPVIKTTNTINTGSGNAIITITPSLARGVGVLKYSYSLDDGATVVDLIPVEGVANTYTATQLPNNVSITTFKIAAYSYIGYSAWSSAVKAFMIAYSAPGVPVLGSATVAAKKVTVNFSIPAANGSAITGYTYSITNATGDVTTANVGTTLPISIDNMAVGSYTIAVCATNSIGTSAYSAGKAFVIK